MKSNSFLRLLVIITLIASTSLNSSFGQQVILCGSDVMRQKLIAEHPEVLQEEAKYEAYTQNYVANLQAKKAMQISGSHKPTASANAPTLYIIPIVFHILEQNGPENISDAQIMDEMRILNEDWGHTNPDTGYAVSKHFKSIEGNIQVQFRLAQIDPNGNCTNGIDRIYTNLTNQADNTAKLDPWDRNKYVNVWVCKNISNGTGAVNTGITLGYAYLPSEVNANASIDGVLITDYCIGSIGTAANPPIGGSPGIFCRCLTHELGHVFNLEHPFGLTNSPSIIGPDKFNGDNTCQDDGVGDTPITEGYFSYCPTGGGNAQTGSINLADTIYAEICDTVSRDTLTTTPLKIKSRVVMENFQNFMDYSECSMMFTQGQQQRIWAALNSPESGRNNLWDTANLIATGVYTPPVAQCAPVANFYSNTCFVCQDSNADFFDNSTHATPTSWAWTFTGAKVNSSTQKNPVVTFDSLYSQTVSLTASNSGGSSTLTQNGYIYVSPPWPTYYGTFSEGFENPAEVSTNWLFYNTFNNSTHWQYTNAAAFTGSGSLMLNSFQSNVYNNNYSPPLLVTPATGQAATWDAITPSVDFKTASSMVLSFDYSCATEASTYAAIQDSLTIGYSLNCGKTWKSIKSIIDTALITAGMVRTSFTPVSPSEWKHANITIPAILNGKQNVRFRFHYVSCTYSNNLYIDDVNLNGTVGIVPVSSENYHLVVYPNPTSNEATIAYYLSNDQSINIGLYDIAGRELKEITNGNQIAGQHTINLNGENLSNGIYFVKLVSGDNQTVTQKLIVIK